VYWYYGTFTKAGFDVPTCLSVADASFQRHSSNVLLPPDGYTTVGGTADSSLIVQVTCVPQGDNTWVVVTAFSDNDNLAKNMRNNVQSEIQAEVRID
jgi:hypothetical protein